MIRSFRPQSRILAMARPLRHQIVIVVLLLATVAGGLWQYIATEATSRSLLPLSTAVAEIGHDIAEFHIWLEEALQGDELLTRDAVMARIDGVAARVDALLAGGAIGNLDLPTVTDDAMRRALVRLRGRVDELQALATQRFDMGDAGVAGTEIDQVFDEYYYVTTRAYHQVSASLESLIQNNLARVSNISIALIAISIGLKLAIVAMIVLLHKSSRREILQLSRKVTKKDKALRDYEKSKDEQIKLLGMMGHELRTPLNAIIGFSEIMKSEKLGEMPPRYKDYAGHIHDSADRFLCVANALIDLSRAEIQGSPKWREPIDLRRIAEQTANILQGRAAEGGVTVVVDIDLKCSAMVSDKKLVGDILINLLHNAIKFTPPGGEVRLDCARQGDRSVLSVQDTGIGMAPEEIDRAMQPFTQIGEPVGSAEEGSGLGLTVARLAAERLGGTFRISSEKDVGTRVEVTLPRRP